MRQFILLSLILSSLSLAQQRFVCLDSNRILQESQAAKKSFEELRERQQFYQAQLDEKVKRLEDLKKQIESRVISQRAREERIKEYQKLEAEAIELQQKAQRELIEMKVKMEEDLTRRIKEISEDISKKNNFTGVLDCAVFAYKSAEIDITDEVIKRLDVK